ncbi:hypothetical protein [Paenibacillus sp. FSL R7-0337]|uniref:hypothetical protein n=1 Tax=Paenibacillus sp. FSL R7-0337 TaxID=1926588 RepID=UPI00096FA106|nr:hypothetical protein [Paenibacillus sp. FSL R7-0337]OMF90432.1 hypothetical protein BK147_23920 [Paenibacillus sp. FSL R7-0337]
MNRKNRKEIVKALGKHFVVKPKYMGAPSFAYEFETPNGVYVVDQAGKVTNHEGNEVELKTLLSGSHIEGVIELSDHSYPADSVDPAASADPSESEAPNAPVSSDVLEAPVAPADPFHREGSLDADDPNDPIPPADVDPAESESSLEPTTPSDQAEPSITDLEITVPMGDHTGLTLRNLANLIYSRQTLMAKALGYDGNIIEDVFIVSIHEQTVDTSEKLMAKISEVSNFCPGITFDFDSRKLTFKFFQGEPTTEKVQAYTQFVDLLNQTAKTLKYASSKSKDTDNDKFTFRLFLIRLGMIGDAYKAARKVLLDKLEGNSAFRNGNKAEKIEIVVGETAESVS